MSKKEGRKSKAPSPKQRKVLEEIRSYHTKHGHSPTLADIGRKMNLTPQTVAQHVEALETKGLIRRKRGEARTIVPVNRK